MRTGAPKPHQAQRHNPTAAWLEMRHAPRRLLSASGRSAPFASLAGQPVAAFCGIGNPAGFRHTLAQCGFADCELREFPDHHAYGPQDIASLGRRARERPAPRRRSARTRTWSNWPWIISTGLPLWAVEIGLEITVGQEALEREATDVALGRVPETLRSPH